MCCCEKCGQTCGLILLVAGLLFLLADLGIWNFWGINWWTVLFILFGVGALMKGHAQCCAPEVKETKPLKKK